MPSLPASIGRYQILDRLGEGGMGVVYLARDPQLQRTIAIKMLSGQGDARYDGELRERFAREARSVAGLKHSHIVTVYDVGEDQGRPFIAMEFLDGESMAQLIERRAQMAVERKVRLALELCSGLGYAHRLGIIHRDIKPANLMITGEGTLKILDFGLARAMASVTNADLTQVGMLIGTPHYMSPEQVLGKPIDQRSDIFSVGVVLYEFFTFKRAFEAPTQPLVLAGILHAEPTPMRDLAPSVMPALERVVERALRKDPESRYQSLSALASDLEQAVADLDRAAAETTIVIPLPAQGVAEAPTLAARSAPGSGSKRTAPSVRSVARRPLFLTLAALVAAIIVVALYLSLVRGRSPQPAATPSTVSAGAPSTSGKVETTNSPSAAAPERPVSQAATPLPSVTTPAPVVATPSVEAAAASIPAVPPKPLPGSGRRRSADVVARCTQLNERASLGEALDQTERDFLAQQCRN